MKIKFNKLISESDFSTFLGCCNKDEIPKSVWQLFRGVDTRYREATTIEVEQYCVELLTQIQSHRLRRTIAENLHIWEQGWNENLTAFRNQPTEEQLRPKYFRQCRFFRLNKKIIIPSNINIEHDLFRVIRQYLFLRFLSPFHTCYELGSGSGQNLYALAKLFPEKHIRGLDWTNASKKIAALIGKTLHANVRGHLFDLMHPSNQLAIPPNSALFTIHAIEQVGTQHTPLLKWIFKNKPKLIMHYEPIIESFSQTNVYDLLARMYCIKRNYLKNFQPSLHQLEKRNCIEILHEHRPHIGGIYHDSTFIVWRPK